MVTLALTRSADTFGPPLFETPEVTMVSRARPENVSTSAHAAESPVDASAQADTVTFDGAQSGRHRGSRRAQHPATLVTAAIAAGSVALAGFAMYDPASAVAEELQANVDNSMPVIADSAVKAVQEQLPLADVARTSVVVDDLMVGVSSVQASHEEGQSSTRVIAAEGDKLKAEKKAEAKARAEAKAQAEAKAEAEAEAKAQAEAEVQARAEREAVGGGSASRGQERASSGSTASVPESPAEPEPAKAPASSGSPRSIARSMLGNYGWGGDQFGCLESLWAKESGWNPSASNSSSGAYGIPQSLPGSKMASAGSDWRTNPATQIKWGLGYIDGRYGSPCSAWSHSQSNNWY